MFSDFQTREALVTLAGHNVPGLACVGLRLVDSPDVELIESLTVEIELAEGTPLVIRRNPAAFRGVIDIVDDDSENIFSLVFTKIDVYIYLNSLSLFLSVHTLSPFTSPSPSSSHTICCSHSLPLILAANIGLKRSDYYLSVGANVVTVCVYITDPAPFQTSCPVTFPFSILFHLNSATSGRFFVYMHAHTQEFMYILFQMCLQ